LSALDNKQAAYSIPSLDNRLSSREGKNKQKPTKESYRRVGSTHHQHACVNNLQAAFDSTENNRPSANQFGFATEQNKNFGTHIEEHAASPPCPAIPRTTAVGSF
jgi:hypothetical protein